MPNIPGGLWKNFLALQVYGANTGVGKTVFSTLLGAHFHRRVDPSGTEWNLHYVKPVSTRLDDDSDDAYVSKYAGVPVTTLFKSSKAVYLYANTRYDTNPPSNDMLIHGLYQTLRDEANKYTWDDKRGVRIVDQMGVGIVETTGGPLSPGPYGTPQADLFRPLRLPVVLVGDHRLGGISPTISAAESLIMRGYDIDAVVCFHDDGKNENAQYLAEYFHQKNIKTFEIPWIPKLDGYTVKEETQKMQEYYNVQSEERHTYQVAGHIIHQHRIRLEQLKSLSPRTRDTIWQPFTQHKDIRKPSDVLIFDSAYGDFFQTRHTSMSRRKKMDLAEEPELFPQFDGSASWWTQGLGHGNPELSLAAAYAAGRYGHVIFAGATHEPAVTLAERLLEGMENPRLSRCFYSDDGSTAAEAGIKMAFRATRNRYTHWNGSSEDIGILGLKGSYHGDTIGAMDASEPGVYNKKVDWYRARGYWFDFPTVKMRQSKWLIEAPAGMEDDFGPTEYFKNLTEVFDVMKRGPSPRYERYITKVLDKLVKDEGRKFGALVMEPVLLGAGGMLLVDPLFQRSLVQVVRGYDFASAPKKLAGKIGPNDWRGLPVIFDEVFTGLYRLGRFNAASLLRVDPDISIHGNLLTGGLLPLSAALTSRSIFEAFISPKEEDALLHGHSYTAHPIGCHVANTSLRTMNQLIGSPKWRNAKKEWAVQGPRENYRRPGNLGPAHEEVRVWSMWSKETVENLSHSRKVDHVIAIGSVLAVSLRDKDISGSGYTSPAAIRLRDMLCHKASYNNKTRVHTRVLGNVIYFMASLTSERSDLLDVESALLEKLKRIRR